MKKIVVTTLAVALMTGFAPAVWSGESVVVLPHAAKRFATLPADLLFPEGITVNPATRDIFVATFDTSDMPINALLRYSKSGKLEARLNLTPPMLGLAYNPIDRMVYFINFGQSLIQRVDADFDASSMIDTVAAIPGIGAPGPRTVENPDGTTDLITFADGSLPTDVFPAPNALAFDSEGNLYVSDSFQGAVFVINSAHDCATPCTPTAISHHPLLATAGFPPFGANGLALSADDSTLFIANTGDDRVLSLDLNDSSASPEIFAESINGADGMLMDRNGRLWVAANQADQVTVLDENGRVIAELGEHLGINKDGSCHGLCFPASIVMDRNKVFVTNLALPLNGKVGDEPEEDVVTSTISVINVPNLPGKHR